MFRFLDIMEIWISVIAKHLVTLSSLIVSPRYTMVFVPNEAMAVNLIIRVLFWPMAYSTMEVNPSLAKPPLKYNGVS